MEPINSADKLKAVILELENQRALEERMLKEQLSQTYDNLKPANLIQSTVNQIASAPALQDKLLNSVTALTAGYLTNLLFQRVSHSPLKKLVGIAIQFGVTNIIVKNPAVVKVAALVLSNMIKSRSERRRKRIQNTTE